MQTETIQNDLTLATIQGTRLKEFPKDLYIPPGAMLVILEMFEGPLDLLLYLIKKNNLNIVEIPVASITQQYVAYIEHMEFINLELAGDYLEMAAILMEIKSRMLLPVLHPEGSEEDPRFDLIKKLQEYEKIKQAAINLDNICRQDRDYFIAKITDFNTIIPNTLPEIKLEELLRALKQVLNRQDLKGSHNIISENLSVRDKMTYLLNTLQTLSYENDVNMNKFYRFSDFFNYKEGRLGIVVTFIAVLELIKQNLLEISQTSHHAPIYIRLISI